MTEDIENTATDKKFVDCDKNDKGECVCDKCKTVFSRNDCIPHKDLKNTPYCIEECRCPKCGTICCCKRGSPKPEYVKNIAGVGNKIR